MTNLADIVENMDITEAIRTFPFLESSPRNAGVFLDMCRTINPSEMFTLEEISTLHSAYYYLVRNQTNEWLYDIYTNKENRNILNTWGFLIILLDLWSLVSDCMFFQEDAIDNSS